VWQGDRFAHEVSLAGAEQAELLLRSVEGAASEAWPASPPLQSLHVEEQRGRQVALLVGMAGKCHWSAAVELDHEHSRLHWDVACRIRAGELAWLGSRYQSEARLELVESGAISIACPTGKLAVRLERETARAATLAVHDHGLQINAVSNIARVGGAATIRWSYVIEAGA
jgi:hypothetical protein